jgi:DNA-binding CsgD family transcriptional regulator
VNLRVCVACSWRDESVKEATTRLDEWLITADGFIEVAIGVCAHARRAFAIAPCAVALHRSGSGPCILVDTFAPADDRYRLATVSPHLYSSNPMYRPLVGAAPHDDEIDARELGDFARRHAFTGDYGHALVLPLMAPGGVLGSIQCGRREQYSVALRRELVTMATQVSVRLAQLGVRAITAPTKPGLSPRQYQVARLVARGASNAEIADELAISTNTVKKLLKEIFQRVGVHNRTEIAAGFTAIAASWDFPVGITRTEAVTITRGT